MRVALSSATNGVVAGSPSESPLVVEQRGEGHANKVTYHK